MRIKPAIGLVVGPVNETHWGQVLTSPTAYAVVEIEDLMHHAQEKGITTLSRLGEMFCESPISLKQIEDIASRVSIDPVKTLIILVPVGRIVYLVARGTGSVYIKRGQELAKLINLEGAVSGEVKVGDTILLASGGFSSVLTHEELTGLFDHLSPSEVAEKLTLMLHEKSGGEGSAAFVFGVKEFVDTEAAVSPEPMPASGDEVAVDNGVSVHKTIQITMLEKGRKMKASIAQHIQALRGHPKKLTALLAGLFLILFVTSVVLGVRKQTATKQNVQLMAAMSTAQHALDEGVALIELNPVKGRERLVEGKLVLEPLLQTISQRTTEGREVTVLYKKITDNLTIAMRVVEAPLTVFYDMTLLKSSATADVLARSGSTVFIADRATNTVYSMDIGTKNARVLGGGDLIKRIQYLDAHGEKVYVLAEEGVFEIQNGAKKPGLVVKKDEKWGAITSLSVFGGNIYLLDTQKSRIWKNVAITNGFSETREYLNPDTLPDISRATGMTIDGSIYLGTNTGGIFRFTQGKENTFQAKGVDPELTGPIKVYTTDDIKHVYVLDASQNRIVVLDKEGIYISQYKYSGATDISDFTVFEEDKKILLSSKGKLYTIELK